MIQFFSLLPVPFFPVLSFKEEKKDDFSPFKVVQGRRPEGSARRVEVVEGRGTHRK